MRSTDSKGIISLISITDRTIFHLWSYHCLLISFKKRYKKKYLYRFWKFLKKQIHFDPYLILWISFISKIFNPILPPIFPLQIFPLRSNISVNLSTDSCGSGWWNVSYVENMFTGYRTAAPLICNCLALVRGSCMVSRNCVQRMLAISFFT